MAKKILLSIILIITFVSAAVGANRKFTLCIDPGHGGKDTGAPGSFSKEKNINLNVALAFGRYVERNCPDVTVVYTRKTDVFIPLYERAEIANRKKANLFISVHTNALQGNHTMRGFETYTLGDGRSHAKKTNLEVAKRENSVILLEKDYEQHYVGFDPNSPESNIMFEFIQDRNLTKSIELAKMLQRHVCKVANRPNKGVHQQNLAVLRLTSMPACLIELGYISTPDEERMLNDKNQIDKIARGIYNAFVEYKNKYDTGMTIPYKPLSDPLPETVQQSDTQKNDSDVADARQTEQDTKANEENIRNKDRQSESNDRPAQKQQTRQQNKKTKQADKPRQTEKPKQTTLKEKTDDSKPVFKVQIIAASRQLKKSDPNFKGLTDVECYQENGMWKYTTGASNNYNTTYRKRKEILEQFPQAFIIAFKNGVKMDVNQAIREFKQNRNR